MQGGSLTYKPSWFLETFFSLHKLYVKKAKKSINITFVKVTTTTTTGLNYLDVLYGPKN